MSEITPYLLYEDVPGALDWLHEAFGFRERLRYEEPDGAVSHAEMTFGDGGLIMMGDPGGDYRSPKRHGQVSVLIHVYVEDVDAHYQRARAAGATIVTEPTDQSYGDRRYDVSDLEGHRWSFAQASREVKPEEWGAVRA
ncbi:MAG: VOC family protein [Streptomycetales bacterium]